MRNSNAPTRHHPLPIVALLVVGALFVLILPAAPAGAVPAPATSGSYTRWAYGEVKSLEFQGTSQGWHYTATATYGFSVILNQTNTSASTFELAANRTMGALESVQYCSPDCSAAGHYFLNESFHLYETIAATANLTLAGTVDEHGGAVSALALTDSSAHLHANATESAGTNLPFMGQAAGMRSHYLAANIDASSTVTLTPALGIVPENLTGAQTWNSSSLFSAQVGANYAYYGAATGPHGSGHVGPISGNFSFPASGTVSLFGNLTPSDTVVLGGSSFSEVSLHILGPFSMREGLILLPNVSDMFADHSHPWSSQQNGTASASMGYLDVVHAYGGHVGIGASLWTYDSGTNTPASALPGPSGAGSIVAASTGLTDSAPPTSVQGQPESVAAAQSQEGCLLTGIGCPSSGPGGSSARGWVGLLVIGAVVVVVVALAVLVAERRRMPPPAYPNASLYPPGAPLPPARAPVPPAPEPAEDDPLRNLW